MTLSIDRSGCRPPSTGSSSYTSTAAMPGRPARSAASRAPGATSPARLVLTMSAVGFMRARSAAETIPRGASISRRCSDSTSDAAPRARLDVDVGNDPGLADQPELVQALEQRRADRRALADQHQRLGVLEPSRKRVDVLGVVVPDRHLVAGDPGKARQGPDRVLIVVEDRDVHLGSLHR